MLNKTCIVYLLIGIFAVPDQAFAYLDAGSGSMILQLMLGGLAGLVVFLKVSWKWILSRMGIRKEESGSD